MAINIILVIIIQLIINYYNIDTPTKDSNPTLIDTSFTSSSSDSTDPFSSFLSASVSSTTTSPQSQQTIDPMIGRSTEEDNFFNQPTNSTKNKLTTDSILALYGNTSTSSKNTMTANQFKCITYFNFIIPYIS